MIQDDPTVIEPTLKQLRDTFFSHKSKDVSFRKQQLRNLERGLVELKEEFYQALQKDLGYKDKFFANFLQFDGGLNHIKHDISNLDKFAKPRSVDTNLACMPGSSYLVPEPFGVVLILGAWNYPIQTSIVPVASAIAAGNAVILKPSEVLLAPHSSNFFVKLFKNYLDQSLYRVIEGGVQVAIAITKQPFDLIIFTGGTEKGKLVAKAAAENLVPCILELGGKSPCIVDGTIEASKSTKRIVQTKFFNMGQTCISPDYVLVQEDHKAAFLQSLKSTILEFYGENPQESGALSNIINEFHSINIIIDILQAKRVLDYLNDCKGTIVLGGKGSVESKFLEPTVVVDPDLNSKLMQEEIFGPILPVVTYKTNDDVIRFVNQRNKPLALYYFGTSDVLKKRLVNQTSSGGICTNDCIFHAVNPNLPFGGVGYSGYGALYGQTGFDQCSHLKPVLEKSFTGDVQSRYPPYTDSKKKVMGLLGKNGNIMVGDIKRILMFLVLAIAVFLYYKYGCCSHGNNHHHDHHDHSHGQQEL